MVVATLVKEIIAHRCFIGSTDGYANGSAGGYAHRLFHLVVASSKDPQQIEEEVDEVEVKLEGA